MSDVPDLETARGAWQWLVFFSGLIVTGIYAGIRVAKAENKVDKVEGELKLMHDSELLTKGEHDVLQAHCQERTWDKFMLVLEKRDRDFDRKFSQICQGISRIEDKITNQK
jgi:hypothetical protein